MPGRPRVLAVDDDPQVLEMLAEFLTIQDYEAVTAQSAGDAFLCLEATPPDVVLLDFAMPDVDGVTALLHIRASYPELPVIMLTANIDLALARHTLKLGAFHYVAKPFDFGHLADAIRAALASRGGHHRWRA